MKEDKTPLNSFLEEYVKKSPARFHMPGHKGVGEGFLKSAYPYDITEVTGADSLYECSGVIKESEEHFTKLYGAGASLISAGGSTLAIEAMLATALNVGDELIIGRNCHRSAVNTMALLDITPIWLMEVTPESIDKALKENENAKAVYITSPDYFGKVSDIKAISEVTHSHGALLLVDNAHGAHLRFTPKDMHPMTLMADMCADSLHKSLPVLTGGALLHLRDKALWSKAKEKMALFGSSSPSYLIMSSIDSAIPYLYDKAKEDFLKLSERVTKLWQMAYENGHAPLYGTEPARLTLSVSAMGLGAYEYKQKLAKYNIEAEYVNPQWAVFMLSPNNSERDYERLKSFIQNEKGSGVGDENETPHKLPEKKLSIRAGAFAPSETIPIEEAVGRISATLSVPCPPCIALIAPGEQIEEETVKLFKKYGVTKVKVVI